MPALSGSGRLRLAALVVGSLAALAMIVVGCTTVTQGTGEVDAEEAPVYRSSISASIEESAASSSARESERQQSLTTQAVHRSCDTLSTTSVDAISAVNIYVRARNQDAPDAAAKAAPAIDSLNRGADLVANSVSDPLSVELRDALAAWVDAARGVAEAISGSFGPDQFNAAVARLNDSNANALNLCDAAY
jgi:hypothetical protein